MSGEIDFYFEYSSPYGYIAAKQIEALAEKHGRTIIWRPFLLGAVFKREGSQSLVAYPMKGPYSKRDIERSARMHDLPYRWPPKFPILTTSAARATLWAQEVAPEKAVPFIHALYDQIFGKGVDIGPANVVSEIAGTVGLDPDAVLDAVKAMEWKQRLKDVTDAAMDRGVFGSPFMFVDKEPFWGADRLDMLDQWLTRGGW